MRNRFMRAQIETGYARLDCACGSSTYVPLDIDSFEDIEEDELEDEEDEERKEEKRATLERARQYAGDCCAQARIVAIECFEEGILGRLSAPGYMDATDWQPFKSEAEALDELDGRPVLRLRIDAAGADFDLEEDEEPGAGRARALARMLRDIADRLESRDLEPDTEDEKLTDTNGNSCGTVSYLRIRDDETEDEEGTN